MLVEYEENLPKAVVQNRFIAIVYRYLREYSRISGTKGLRRSWGCQLP